MYCNLKQINMYEETNVFLLSNGSSKFFPENTLTKFNNKFPINLEVSNEEKLEVAVQSVGFCSNFKKIHLPTNKTHPAFMIFELKKFVKKEGKRSIFESMHNQNIKSYYEFYFDDDDYSLAELKSFFEKVNKQTKYLANISIDKNLNVITIKTTPGENPRKYFIMIHPNLLESFGILRKSFVTELPESISTYIRFKFDTYMTGINMLNDYNISLKDFYADNRLPNVGLRYDKKRDPLEYLFYYWDQEYITFLIEPNEKTHIFGTRDLNKTQFPFIVKISSPNIFPNVTDGAFANDMVCFSPKFKENEFFYFHEFKNLEYSNLNNTIIDNIEVKILDEIDRQLNIPSGVASFIHLRIRKMKTDQVNLNVRITSKKDKDNPTNTAFKFRKVLPNTFYLDRNWRMSLTSISYPTIFATFNKDIDTRSIHVTQYRNREVMFSNHLAFPFNRCYQRAELLNFINIFLETIQAGKIIDRKNSFEIEWSFSATVEELEIQISVGLLKLLGYDGLFNITDNIHFKEKRDTGFFESLNQSEKLKDNHYLKLNLHFHKNSSNLALLVVKDLTTNKYTQKFYNTMDLKYFYPHYIMIYSNVISPTLVGGEYLKVLKIFPIKYTDSNYTIIEFDHKEFIELQNTEIRELEFELRGHDGEYITFDDNKNVLLNLELTNYEYK